MVKKASKRMVAKKSSGQAGCLELDSIDNSANKQQNGRSVTIEDKNNSIINMRVLREAIHKAATPLGTPMWVQKVLV